MFSQKQVSLKSHNLIFKEDSNLSSKVDSTSKGVKLFASKKNSKKIFSSDSIFLEPSRVDNERKLSSRKSK